MTETELLAGVTALAAERGIRALHIPGRLVKSMGPDWAGFPDLLLIGSGGILWAELKADGRAGQLRASQRQFRYAIVAAGQFFIHWSPAGLRSGEIAETLDGLNEWPRPDPR